MKILIADDHDIVRRGLRQLLTAQAGWEICAEARTGNEAVELAKRFEPQVAIMDISMPQLNGLEATRTICKLLPKTKVVILTMHFSDQLIAEVIKAGASGYVLKSDAGSELVAAVQSVTNSGSYFSAQVASTLVGPHSMPNSSALKKQLTPREHEVVRLLANGKSSKEVAASLAISTRTAETHRAHVMSKLGLHTVSQLVLYAIKNHIVEA